MIETYTTTACEQYYMFFAQDSKSFFSWLINTYEGRSIGFEDFQKLTLVDLVSLTDISLKTFNLNGNHAKEYLT